MASFLRLCIICALVLSLSPSDCLELCISALFASQWVIDPPLVSNQWPGCLLWSAVWRIHTRSVLPCRSLSLLSAFYLEPAAWCKGKISFQSTTVSHSASPIVIVVIWALWPSPSALPGSPGWEIALAELCFGHGYIHIQSKRSSFRSIHSIHYMSMKRTHKSTCMLTLPAHRGTNI